MRVLDVVNSQSSFGVFESLTQYGALGLIVLAMGFALWFLLKRMMKTEDYLLDRIEALQEELNNYIKTDRERLLSVIDNNSKALNEIKVIIEASTRR